MDRNKHRLGTDPEKTNIFSDYMVDYIFTQMPYTASDVALHFGISDHAAITGSIQKT